ncbi:DNA-3-methyladenine glycosylase I [Hallella multisaccharivorax]|uniref:DNA-3-methyladenine glycosylase I n=1 Tax=Hallella multisaccharivorax DSM 17128 TaxID=688246 RepID=F8N913_9BACT|nr:DNA-3-methyladenine glycosylase I [Hallella multisaccharivorax]EGN55658.1 DNA-3-methyladenine glycosylase I [Hallella multisaccharivorax DSM 17128]
MDKAKCSWCQDGGPIEKYHDEEWGRPCHDDRLLYEYLMLEAMSAGLSWSLMIKKRDIFHACFADFDEQKVATFGEADYDRIIAYPGMIRSRRKIEAMTGNARCFIQIQKEYGSFDRYLWHFTNGQTIIYRCHLEGERLTRSELSDEIAKDLKKRGFKFLGSILVYSFLQAVGIINDHEPHCRLFDEIGGTIR